MGRGKKQNQIQRGVGTPSAAVNPNAGAHLPERRLMAMRTESYWGAVPHPDHVERFEAILPGAFDRFLGMAERQSAHRQRMERKFLNFNGVAQAIGVIFAGLTVLGAIAACTYLMMNDKPIAGFTAMLTPLAVVGGIFLRTRKKQQAEIAGKR